MAKQLNVNLAFSADTSKAKAQLASLQQQLSSLMSMPTSNFPMTANIQEAITAAAQLKIHLQNATNIKTGNLDFAKLNQSITSSGQSLSSYAAKLQQLGPAGQQAFMSLANSVAQAEIPIRRSNALLTEMGTTLMNTARWQLSSSILHGFMGAIQGAYGYAKDLNESLNNIRIVTGQSTDQMARFAKQANRAAKELSATTTEYTNASLIYYQQGLNDSEVKARTDVTIKMANASNQSAEVVSDQLTAIWNNFYDGSKSLEYYADVVTALGAATASSSEEIATGLEKFAAVAETVGLSYEYATSALATVTAETRQSADVVGTAFKTLFARLQDLELGETLDDGTTLGKYSQALYAVGINIKDTNGELKDMDVILNELGTRWDDLGKDQQVALAQTVAGTRQYTQLVALMDNWGTFQRNLTTAQTSQGSLQEQADIYSEGWEAARDRVSAAAQGIWDDLIDDEGFIKILNVIEKIVTGIDWFIDSLGGLEGVLAAVGALLTKVFADKIAQGITTMATNLSTMTAAGRQKMAAKQSAFIEESVNNIPATTDYTTDVEKAQQQNLRDNLELRNEMIKNADRMSELELQTNQQLLDRTRIMQEQYELAAKMKMQAQQEETDILTGMKTKVAEVADGDDAIYSHYASEIDTHAAGIRTSSVASADIEDVGATAIAQLGTEGANTAQILAGLKEQVVAIGNESQDGDIQKITQDFKGMDLTSKNVKEALQDVIAKINALKATSVEELGQIVGDPKLAEKYAGAIDKTTKATKKQVKAQQEAEKARKVAEKSIKKSVGSQKTWADSLVKGAHFAMSAAMAINALGSMWDTWSDPDTSVWQKLTTTLMSLGMIIPTVVSGIKGIGAAQAATMASTGALSTALSAEIAARGMNIAEMSAEEVAKKLKISTDQAEILITRAKVAEWAKEQLARKANLAALNAEEVAKKLGITTDQAEIIISKLKTGSTIAEAMAEAGLTTAKGTGIIATIAQTAANWALNASMSPVLAITLLIIAALAILAVGIMAVVGVIKLISDAWNADAIAAENANKKLGEAKQIVEDTTKAYEDLKASIEDYRSAQSAIEAMTEGTKEWKEAVREANLQVLDLMNNYPELAQYVQNVNGRLTISEEGLDSVLDAQYQRVLKAQSLQSMRQIRANQANSKSKKTDFARSTVKLDQDDLNKLQNLYDTGQMEQYHKTLDSLVDGNKNLASSATNLIASESALKESNELLKQSIIEAANLDNDKYNNSQYKDYINYLGGQELDESSAIYQQEKAHVQDLWSGYNEDFWAEYLQYVMGEESVTQGSNEVTGENYRIVHMYGSGATIQKRTSEGSWENIGEEDSLSETEAEKELIAARVAERTSENIDEYEQYADAINTNLQAAGLGKRENDTDSSYQARLNNIGLQFVKGEAINLSDLTWKEVQGLDTSAMGNVTNSTGQNLKTQMDGAIDNYVSQRLEKNLQASSKWLEEKADRDAADLSKVLADAEMDQQDFKNYTKQFAKWGDQADEVAKQVLKTSNAVHALNTVFEDSEDVLKEGIAAIAAGEEPSAAFATAVGDIQTALTDWLGVDLGYDFVVDKLDLIEKAANKDEEAIKSLQIAAARQIVVDMDIPQDVADKLNGFINEFEASDIQIGATLDSTDFVKTLNDMMASGQMTAEQVTSYLNSIGYSPKIDYDTVKQGTKHEYSFVDPIIGKEWKGSYTVYTDMKVPKINAEGTVYTGPALTTTPAMANSDGGGDKRDPKDYKFLDEELDRYHEIKEVIDDLSREYDALSEARSRAFGQQKLALIDKEIAKTQELIEAQEDYLSQLQEGRAEEAAQLTKDYGASFDSQGRISNYDELYKSSLATYNKAVDAYNAGSMSEEEFETYEKAWETFVEDLENYEETLNTLEEEQVNFINLQNQMADLALEKIQYKVELEIKLEDAELQQLEHQLEHLDDSVDDLSTKLALLGKSAEVHLNKIAAYENGVKEAFAGILSENDIAALLDGDNSVLEGITLTENQVAALEEWRDGLYEANNALIELRETMQESIISAFEDMNDKMQDSADRIDHLTGVLSSYREIIGLIGEDTLGISDEIMEGLNQSIVKTSTDALRTAKATYDMNKKALADAQEERAKAEAEGRTEDVKMWDETIKTIQEQTEESQADMLDLWQTALDEAATAFEDSVDRAIKAAEKSLSGMYGSFEKMQTAFEQQSEINERYLDDYAKIYELNKLIRDVGKSIDATDNVKAKKELRKIEEEIAAIYESEEEVSQYQVDHMRAQYELRLAQIALEEAQNAKSKVRMRKDSEGNWSYVYTADGNAIETAEQAYEDKLYELQNLIQEYIREMQEGAINAQADMMSAIADLRVQDFASEQEYQAEVTRIIEYYTGMRKYYMSELNKALSDSKEVYEEDWLQYSKYTGYKISQDDKWVQDYKETAKAIIDGTTSIEQDNTNFENVTTDLLQRLSGAYSQWHTNINGYNEAVGHSMDTLGEDVEEMAGTIETETDSAAGSAEDSADRMSEAFDDILEDVSAWQSDYSGYIDDAIQSNRDLIQSIDDVIAAAARAAATDLTPDVDYSQNGNGSGMDDDDVGDADGNGDKNTGGTDTTGGLTGSTTTDSNEGNTSNDKPAGTDYDASPPTPAFSVGTKVRTKEGFGFISCYKKTGDKMESNGSWGTAWGKIKLGAIQEYYYYGGQYYYKVPGAGAYGGGWIKGHQIETYDTGGYTGAWGSSGRLAMLHQKELVLNAQDTENMLNAVNIIRDISRVIDLNAASSANAFGLLSTALISNGGQTIEQEVTIHAEFPNATNHTEIEEAFNTLINQAAQFANRKN